MTTNTPTPNEHIYLLTQPALKIYVDIKLKNLGYTVYSDNGWLVAIHETATQSQIALVAHLDTVHSKEPIIEYNNTHTVMSSSTGLGADDRAGVDMIMQLAESDTPPATIILLEDEELMGVGANKAILSAEFHNIIENIKPDVLIELDRMNSHDCAIYEDLCDELISYFESLDFNICYGSYTDIATLCPSLRIPGVNLSIGYFNQHTLQEYLNIPAWKYTYYRILRMLRDTLPTCEYIGTPDYDSYLEEDMF